MNQTVLITGATSGIGRAAAEELAARGWTVIGVGRSQENCFRAENEIKSFYPDARLTYLTADLSSLKEVNRLADAVSSYLDQNGDGRLAVLVNNAASVKNWYTATEDGYETQFAVNYLAGFLLAQRLLPHLAKSPHARVLTVSSNSHKGTRIRWNDIMNRKHYNCLRAYKQSKLCNVLFVNEWNRRLHDTSVRAYAVDPGLVNTDIGSKSTEGLVAWFWRRRKQHGLSPFQAAATITYLSKMPADWQSDGAYYKHCAPGKPSKAALDEQSGRRLWDLSQQLCGLSAEA